MIKMYANLLYSPQKLASSSFSSLKFFIISNKLLHFQHFCFYFSWLKSLSLAPVGEINRKSCSFNLLQMTFVPLCCFPSQRTQRASDFWSGTDVIHHSHNSGPTLSRSHNHLSVLTLTNRKISEKSFSRQMIWATQSPLSYVEGWGGSSVICALALHKQGSAVNSLPEV